MEIVKFPRIRGKKIDWRICLLDAIISYSNHIGTNYEMMFSNILKFDLSDKKNTKIWERITFPKASEDLKKYHGISRSTNKNGIDRVIECVEKGKVVIVLLDIFNCPWKLDFYQQVGNLGHHFIVTEFNDNKFRYFDPGFDSEGYIDIENMKQGYYLHYEMQYSPCDEEYCYRTEFEKSIESVIHWGYKKKTNLLINELLDELSEVVEKDYRYYETVFMNIEFAHICYTHYLSYMVECLKLECEVIDNISKDLVKISSLYRIIQLTFRHVSRGKFSLDLNKLCYYTDKLKEMSTCIDSAMIKLYKSLS